MKLDVSDADTNDSRMMIYSAVRVTRYFLRAAIPELILHTFTGVTWSKIKTGSSSRKQETPVWDSRLEMV